nr:uncharacterized protein LOC129415601 [Misgurnus anguillicaudatus]
MTKTLKGNAPRPSTPISPEQGHQLNIFFNRFDSVDYSEECRSQLNALLLLDPNDTAPFSKEDVKAGKPPPDATPPAATSSSSRREPGSDRALLPAWFNDALDDSVLVDALVTFESQKELLPISTSQPVSARSPEQLPLSTSVPATAEHPEQSPLRTSKKAKRSKHKKPLLSSTSKAASDERPEQPTSSVHPEQPMLLPSSAPGESPPDARPEGCHRPPTARLRLPPPCRRVTILWSWKAVCGCGKTPMASHLQTSLG